MLFQDHMTWMSTHLIQYKGQYWVVQGCLAMQYSWICHLSNVRVDYVCFSFECICLPHSSFRCWYQCRENTFVQNVIATPYCQSPPSDETRWLYHLHHRPHQSPRYRHTYFNRISVLDGTFSCSPWLQSKRFLWEIGWWKHIALWIWQDWTKPSRTFNFRSLLPSMNQGDSNSISANYPCNNMLCKGLQKVTKLTRCMNPQVVAPLNDKQETSSITRGG